MASESVVFDRAAGFYDETRGFPPGIAPHAAELIRSTGNLKADSRILEIGIGTGRISLPLAPHVKAIFGVDLSLPMMNRLREKQQNEPIYISQADITRLPFPTARFDAVVACHIFHLVPTWRTALQEAGRVLKSGAPLLTCWNGGRDDMMPDLRNAWREVVPEEDEKPFGITRDQYESFPIDEGWQPVTDTQTYTFGRSTSPAEFIRLAERRSWSGTWHLTDEQIAEGVARVREVAEREYDDLDAPIEVQSSFNVRAYLPPAN